MLKMNNVGKVYRTELIETHALRDLNLHVEEGEFIAVTGPSGSGKTTFLNIAGLLESPSSGVYELDGANVGDLNDRQRSRIRNEKVGFIFQSFNLLSRASALKNVMQPLVYRGIPRTERKRLAAEALDNVGLGDRLESRPNQMSGGQRQRLAIARALLKNAPILILDEATSQLDSESEALVQKALSNLMAGRTTLVIAHRLSTVMTADRIVVMDGGRIVEQGDHEQLLAVGGLYRRLYDLQFEA